MATQRDSLVCEAFVFLEVVQYADSFDISTDTPQQSVLCAVCILNGIHHNVFGLGSLSDWFVK